MKKFLVRLFVCVVVGTLITFGTLKLVDGYLYKITQSSYLEVDTYRTSGEVELKSEDIITIPDNATQLQFSYNNKYYAYLEDGPNVGEGKNFTAAQKQKMLEENMKRNGGVVKSDNPNDYFETLTKPQKSQKGVTPSPDEWQFDHIIPKDKGGTNSYSNCQIVSRKFNREKWNN